MAPLVEFTLQAWRPGFRHSQEALILTISRAMTVGRRIQVVRSGVQLMCWRSRALCCVWVCLQGLGHTSWTPQEVLINLWRSSYLHTKQGKQISVQWMTVVKPRVEQPSQTLHLSDSGSVMTCGHHEVMGGENSHCGPMAQAYRNPHLRNQSSVTLHPSHLSANDPLEVVSEDILRPWFSPSVTQERLAAVCRAC